MRRVYLSGEWSDAPSAANGVLPGEAGDLLHGANGQASVGSARMKRGQREGGDGETGGDEDEAVQGMIRGWLRPQRRRECGGGEGEVRFREPMGVARRGQSRCGPFSNGRAIGPRGPPVTQTRDDGADDGSRASEFTFAPLDDQCGSPARPSPCVGLCSSERCEVPESGPETSFPPREDSLSSLRVTLMKAELD